MAPDWKHNTHPLHYDCFLAGMGLLTSNYPPRGGTDDTGEALLAAWWSVLGPLGNGWLTNALFVEGVQETLRTPLKYLPTVRQFADVCLVCRRDAEREATPRLPAPPAVDVTQPPRGYDRAKWDRNVAIGKARQRKRNARIAQWRKDDPHGWPPTWPHGDFDPTEQEIDAVLRAMAATGQRRGTLDAALAIRVPVGIGVGEWWETR